MPRIDQISNQDYSLIKTKTRVTTKDMGLSYGFTEEPIGFQFLILSRLFGRQEDEIITDITDTIFLTKLNGVDCGPDRGVDAIIIDNDKRIVHIFNSKYTSKDISRVKTSAFPGGEVNEITAFIRDVYEKNAAGFTGAASNDRLEQIVKELWQSVDKGVEYKYQIHFIANLFRGLPEHEEARLKTELDKYRGVSFDYLLVSDLADALTKREVSSDAKFMMLNNNYFEKSESGNSALVLEIPAIELLRMTIDDEELRSRVEYRPEEVKQFDIAESIFEDNVRVYLKQRTDVNRNIKNTAIDDSEKHNIFFYNNGITITCDRFIFQGTRNAVVSIKNFQIVNGGQTIHALRSAFDEKSEGFDKITILCKIYQTEDQDFKSKIAEYTNSQNPVRDRDIRSIDQIQITLEKELLDLGYFYERKRNQHESESRDKKIDAEKFGQAFLAYSLNMPGEAKNKKSVIFGEKYDEIFNDNTEAENVIDVFRLYQYIEIKKLEQKIERPYLMHATYYIMFFIRLLTEQEGYAGDPTKCYDMALEKIELIIDREKHKLADDYSDAILFKSNRPKDYIADLGL